MDDTTCRKGDTYKKKASEVVPFDENAIVSFAVGELGLRLQEFYLMPFCEFILKSQAYNRMQEERLRHTRRIAFYSMIGSHLDPKKLPKSEDKFMPIGTKVSKSNISEEDRQLFLEEMRKYEESVNNLQL